MKKLIIFTLFMSMLALPCFAEPERWIWDTASNSDSLYRYMLNPLLPGNMTFKDISTATFGAGSDVTVGFDGTNFEILAAAADTPFAIGAVATGFDLTYYFETAGTIAIDYDGDSMTISDNMDLVFGTNADWAIEYDESGTDFLTFTGATSDISFTCDSAIFTLDDAAADQFKIDATGTVVGNAIVLETTDGGIHLNADGGANGDIAIDAADNITIDALGLVTYTGAFYAAEAVLETHTTNDTLDAAADVGTLMLIGTDAVILTLPAVATGLKYKVMNVGSVAGTVEIHVDTNGSDKILGGCGFTALDDGDKLTNTQATSSAGDYVIIEYGTADGWFITEMVGTWADGGA